MCTGLSDSLFEDVLCSSKHWTGHVGMVVFCIKLLGYKRDVILASKRKSSCTLATAYNKLVVLSISVQNNRNNFLIRSCTPFCPQNSLNSWSPQGVKSIPQAYVDFQSFPQLCQVAWMSFGWRTILDTHGKLFSVSTLQCAWHLLPCPIEKAIQMFCLAHSPSEWHTQTIHVSIVSRLKNP